MTIKQLDMAPDGCSCYVAAGYVIDPGANPKRIIRYLESQSITPKGVLLTHGHIDHIAALPGLLSRYPGLKFYIHEEDAIFLKDPRLNLSRYPSFVLNAAPEIVHDQDVINGDFRVWHMPGHTPGSCMYELIGTNHLFCGDMVFRGDVGRDDLPLGSAADMKKSIARLKEMNPDFLLYPGHDGLTTLAEELSGNPYLQ